MKLDQVTKQQHKYSLDCSYYKKEFDSIEELMENVMMSGMDPSYEITLNGKGMGEMAVDYLYG
jgi:hypothetical protein